MSNINYWAVVVAAPIIFILSSVYYSVLSTQRASFSSTDLDAATPMWRLIPLELLRSLTVICVFAFLLTRAGEFGVLEAVSVALLLWIGFPIVLLAGSVLHEGVPWQLAALHGGDWLIKLVAIAVILGLWK